MYLPNHAKVAASLIFSNVCGKGIFFTFCFVNSILLRIYFPKYLQFPLNTITHCKNHVTEHVFLEDNGPWKWKFFIFANFIFLTLDDFSKKTYEKTCRFYNIFSKSVSNSTRLPSFMIWMFFWKLLRPFQSNIHFFTFNHISEKTYEKTYQFHDLFSKFLPLCTGSQNFVIWKFLLKQWQPFQNLNNFLFISATLSNICDKTYEKTYHFFHIFSNFHFIFTCWQNFVISK